MHNAKRRERTRGLSARPPSQMEIQWQSFCK